MVLRCKIGLKIGERKVKEVSLDPNPVTLKQDYLDVFKGVKADIIHSAKYNENYDKWTTYPGTFKVRRHDELRTKHKILLRENCDIHGKLLDGTNFKIQFDTGSSKSFI